jgi:hypothetical protein
MANIILENLDDHNISGIDLFHDSENFLRDLSENEFDLRGGMEASSPYLEIYPSPIYQVVLINMVVNAVLQFVLNHP